MHISSPWQGRTWQAGFAPLLCGLAALLTAPVLAVMIDRPCSYISLG